MPVKDYLCSHRAKNGRTAVFLRQDEGSPWVQVQSASGLDDPLQAYYDLYDLEDAEVRALRLKEASEDGEDWGDHAAVEPPT